MFALPAVSNWRSLDLSLNLFYGQDKVLFAYFGKIYSG